MGEIEDYKKGQSILRRFGILSSEQTEWLNKCCEVDESRYKILNGGSWYLDPITGLVNVEGCFDCSGQGLKDFKGIEFGVVTEGFDCSNNLLTNLIGAPRMMGEFLDGEKKSPIRGGNYFNCDNNLLTSLEGAPKIFGSLGNYTSDLRGRLSYRGNPIDESVLASVHIMMVERRIDFSEALNIFKSGMESFFSL